MRALVLPDVDLELWALNEAAYTGDPRALLSTIPAESLRNLANRDLRLEWDPNQDVMTPAAADWGQ